jgi:hypothetical protein
MKKYKKLKNNDAPLVLGSLLMFLAACFVQYKETKIQQPKSKKLLTAKNQTDKHENHNAR